MQKSILTRLYVLSLKQEALLVPSAIYKQENCLTMAKALRNCTLKCICTRSKNVFLYSSKFLCTASPSWFNFDSNCIILWVKMSIHAEQTKRCMHLLPKYMLWIKNAHWQMKLLFSIVNITLSKKRIKYITNFAY